MDFSFNSVEIIPGLNSSAAFTTSTNEVFKEQEDTSPVIIDKQLNYMPWGAANDMPYRILDLIESDETLSTCQIFNAEVCYGSGLVYVTAHALMAAIPSIDLVLTPNGFGIVNTGNIAPASRDRVERLIASVENERDCAIESMLLRLPKEDGWLQTDQSRFFASTLFPNLSLCRRLAIRQHLWEEYNALRSRLIKIENTLAETYFSQEQMAVFREKSIHLHTDCHPQMLHVIRALQSCELMLVTDMEVHCQSFYDLVNIIRQHPETFPEWHNSHTAQLYIPKIFENKKSSSGYWF